MSQPDPLSRSSRLGAGKFVGALEGVIWEDEQVLLADDCDAEIFEVSQPSPKSKLVGLLTSERIVLVRGRGLTGPKRPWTMLLEDLEQAGVTEQGNVNLRSTNSSGEPHLWKLVLRDPVKADEWFAQVDEICNRPPPEAELLVRLHTFLSELEALVSPDQVGQPFGPGLGLERAIGMVQSHFRDVEEVRFGDRLAIVELLSQTPGDDPQTLLLEIMGAEEVLQSHPGEVPPNLELAGAAVELLDQFETPRSLWKLWEEREDVALELFAWHCVARARLTAAEILPPAGPGSDPRRDQAPPL